jgi:hypothetical protein
LRTYEDKVDYTFSEFARERIAFGGSGEQWVPATVIKDPGSNQNFIQNDYLTRDLRVSERKPYRGNAVDTIAGPVMPSGTVTLPCARQPRSQYMFSGPKPDLRETEREYQVSGRMNYIISVPKPGYSYPMEEGNPVDFHIIDTNGKWGHAILGREARYEREDPQAFWSHKPKETPTPSMHIYVSLTPRTKLTKPRPTTRLSASLTTASARQATCCCGQQPHNAHSTKLRVSSNTRQPTCRCGQQLHNAYRTKLRVFSDTKTRRRPEGGKACSGQAILIEYCCDKQDAERLRGGLSARIGSNHSSAACCL